MPEVKTTETPSIPTAPQPLDFNTLLLQRYSRITENSPTSNTEKVSDPPATADNSKKEENETLNSTKVKRVKASSSKPILAKPEVPIQRYSDLGGIEGVLEDIQDLVERPFRFPEVYRHLGVEPPRGILLHGAPGSGKTCLAMAIAGELGVPLLQVSAPELVSGMSGESEGKIRDLFEQAKTSSPCILFLDEIDAITPKRETAQREMERRIVAQLLTCMDDLGRCGSMVMVLGATNRPDSLDPALRRAGRFDRELKLNIPNEEGRAKILEVLCKKLKLSGDIDLKNISRNTPGYVGADLKALTQEAANIAVRRIFSQLQSPPKPGELVLENSFIGPEDFQIAIKKIQPSAKREGFAVVPDTKWEDIGALKQVRDELRMAIVEPIRHPEKFEAVGLTAPAGVLLWGPPGCGKTLLAKAVANESHSNFISVKGPELLNKYVGESERAVRQVFERARHSAPCVVFFDELDALCPRRSDESDSATSRVVNQLLTEMDGLEGRRQVFIMAATNRPDMIDPAMTRPGRLDKLLYVNLPDRDERIEILKAVSKGTPWSSEIDLERIAKLCESFSGADLNALVREASIAAVRELISNDTGMQVDPPTPVVVGWDHVEIAINRVVPSVSPRDLAAYEQLNQQRKRS